MGKSIQMIWTSEDNCLFLYGLTETGELTFRSSRNIQHLQKENILIKDGLCYTRLYHFPIIFLEKLIN